MLILVALSGCFQAAEAPSTEPTPAVTMVPVEEPVEAEGAPAEVWRGDFTLAIAIWQREVDRVLLQSRVYVPAPEAANVVLEWSSVDRAGALVQRGSSENFWANLAKGDARYVRLEATHVPSGQVRVTAIALIGEGRIEPAFRGCDGGINGVGPGCSDLRFTIPSGTDRLAVRADPLMPGNLQEGRLQIIDPSGQVRAEDREGWFDPTFDLYFYRAGLVQKNGLEPGEWTARFVPDFMVWGDVGFQGGFEIQEHLLNWPVFYDGWRYDPADLDEPLPDVDASYSLFIRTEQNYGTFAPTDVHIEGRSDIFNRSVPPEDHTISWTVADGNGTIIDSRQARAFDTTLLHPGIYRIAGTAMDGAGNPVSSSTKVIGASGIWSSNMTCSAGATASGPACDALEVYLPANVSYVYGQAAPYRAGDAQTEHEVLKTGRLLLWPPGASVPIEGTYVETAYGSWSYVKFYVEGEVPPGSWRLEWDPDMSIIEEGKYLLRATFAS